MPIIVQKFGGGVIRNLEALERVADLVSKKIAEGNIPVVVVSAMGNKTDELIRIAKKVNPSPPARELDMLLSVGERFTAALLSLALDRRGYHAVSFTGSQVGIITNNEHTDAKIISINGKRIIQAIKNKTVPIVAGFQGVSIEKEITTLGRGGSDITAVALAAFLNADCCEFYKDVTGIFAENPKLFPLAKPIKTITYEELVELTSSGAEIIAPRACELAIKYDVPIAIKSFWSNTETVIINQNKIITRVNMRKTENLEKPFVRAVTHMTNLTRLTLIGIPQLPRCLHQVVVRFAEAKVSLVFFSHGVADRGKFDLSFIVTQENLPRAIDVIENAKKSINAKKTVITKNIASISLIGPGVNRDPDIFCKALEVFHSLKVHVDAFSSSETKITYFINQKDLIKSINALLKKFKLTKQKS
jgi:aspartate kinase